MPLRTRSEDALAVVLRQVGAQLVGVIAKALEHDGNKVYVDLGVAEDDGAAGVFHLDQADQGALAAAVGRLVDDVLGLGDVDVVATEADELGVAP